MIAEPARGGFVIPLTYGAGVDRLENVPAAGSARLVVDGVDLVADRPETIPAAEAAEFMPVGKKRALDRQGVSDYLRLDVIGQERDRPRRKAPAGVPRECRPRAG